LGFIELSGAKFQSTIQYFFFLKKEKMPVLSKFDKTNSNKKHEWWEFEKKKFSEFEPITDDNKRIFIHVSFDDLSSDTIITWKYYKKWMRKNRTTLKQRFETASKLIDHLDEVPTEIIGKFKVAQAFERAPYFAKWIIRFSLADDHQEFSNNNMNKDTNNGVEERDEKTWKEIITRKKIPSGIINDLVAEAVLSALVQQQQEDIEQDDKNNNNNNISNNNTLSSNLYVSDPKLTNKWMNECTKNNIMPKGDVSIFVVDKSSLHQDGTPVQRIITDARAANARLHNPAQMELFTLEALLQRMATVTQDRQPVFALACDLRHWFHQIPLPRRYRRYLRIKLKEKYVYPSCWPMGFHMSPAIAQACTWTILLADLDKNDELTRRKRKSLGIISEMKFNEYIQWLPLEDGGGVFVLIDNIFIITKSEQIKEKWKRRIEQNAHDLGATLKEVKTEKATTNGEKIFFEEQKLINKNNDSPTINFSGIEFSLFGRRTVEEIDEVQQLEQNNNNINDRKWTGSYRDLASILGQCLWTYRVRGTRMLELEDLLDLYSEKAFPRQEMSWDAQAIIINEDKNYFDILQRHYNICRHDRNFVKYEQVHKQESFAFIASDAAFRREENKQYEQNMNNKNKNNNKEENFIGGILLHPNDVRSSDDITEKISLIFKEEHNEEGIALAELKAVVVSIRKLLELYPNDPPDTYMIAIDSMAAKGMISRGFSRVPRARELLKELFHMVGTRKIFIMYIESEKNPADAPSRNEVWKKIFNTEQKEKWSEVLSRLENNKIFALTSLTKNGKQVAQPVRNAIRREREGEE
jgi:hypothetical protein